MKKLLSVLAVVILITSMSSCKKEDLSPIPSPWLAERGTNIPDNATCKDEVAEFVNLFQQCRAKHGNPTIFYDRRLIDIIKEDDGSSAYNKIDAEYYVSVGDRVRHGKFITLYFEETIESPISFFEKVERKPENYQMITGNFSENSQRFFWEYDLAGINLKKYTDGCLAGNYKLTIIVWAGLPPHN